MSQHDTPPGDPRYNAPLEKVFEKIVTPFEQFIHNEATSGLVLMFCTLIALLIANSLFADAYHHLLQTSVTLGVGGWTLEKTLHHWVNDGLMALFFFVVGLEIKREVLVGELADPRQAILPIIAAFGGMIVPALLYLLFNHGTDTAVGWGIPMATDIAFAVGILILLGKRVPGVLLTLMVALAIVDDLGAVIVIALFYTDDLMYEALGFAALFFITLVAFNLSGIRRPLPYFLVGGLLWLAMLKSGVHATIAGILTALTIPARPKYDPVSFSHHVRRLMSRFDGSYRPGESIMNNENQRAILQSLENAVQLVQTPLQRLEHSLHITVAFLIIPIFALANAGIPIYLETLGEVFQHPVSLGIMAGLVIGKCAGIAGLSLLAIKFGIARMPEGTSPAQLIGIGLIGGVGFTMSIFIAELGFADSPENLLMAKTGILFASVIAGVAGYLWLYFIPPGKQPAG